MPFLTIPPDHTSVVRRYRTRVICLDLNNPAKHDSVGTMNLERVSVLLLAVIAFGLIAAAMDFAQPVIMPLVIALLLSFVLAPIVDILHRLHIPRPIAIAVVILMLLGLFFLVALIFYTSIQSFVRNFPQYQARLQELIDGLSMGLSESLGMETDLLSGIDWPTMIRDYLLTLSGSFFDFMTSLFVVTIFLIFLLLEQPFLKSKLEAAFEAGTSAKIGLVMEHINLQIGRYLGLKLAISAATGFLIWLLLFLIGMDFPIIWGFLGFVLNFIPSIGSTVHFFVTSIMAFIQYFPDSIGKVLAVVLSMLAIQTIIGNIMDPRLQGRRLNLSPFLVLFSLILWGWLWGAVGMLLATPLTVAIKIVCENIPAFYPASVLMGKGAGHSG